MTLVNNQLLLGNMGKLSPGEDTKTRSETVCGGEEKKGGGEAEGLYDATSYTGHKVESGGTRMLHARIYKRKKRGGE